MKAIAGMAILGIVIIGLLLGIGFLYLYFQDSVIAKQQLDKFFAE